MARLKVEVTQRDLLDGIPGDPCACPVALALSRAGVYRPYVLADEIVGRWPREKYDARFCVPTPDEVYSFVEDFDEGRDDRPPAVPFDFELELPEVG